jgi:hypothetical protein
MLQPKKLTSAVAIAVGASAVAFGTAQAGSLLFPQIAVSPSVTTIITVMNAGDGYERPVGSENETLHYRYYWKPWLDKTYNADDPNTLQVENRCVERNRYLPTSKNDIQTFDIGNVAFGSAGRGVMFLDESVNNDWDFNPVNYSLGDEATLTDGQGAHRAFLLVDNFSEADWGPDLAGEAILVDVAAGATWGYQAFANSASEDFDFSDFASFRYSLVSYMPSDEVTTRFLVTVLDGAYGDDMAAAPDSRYQNTAHIGLRVIDGLVEPGNDPVPGVYDRDENFNSGGIDRPVTCVGAWDIQDLYPDAAFTTPGGGWTNVTNYYVDYDVNGVDADPDDQTAAIFKVEYGTSIDGTALGGVFNNGLYLHPYR